MEFVEALCIEILSSAQSLTLWSHLLPFWQWFWHPELCDNGFQERQQKQLMIEHLQKILYFKRSSPWHYFVIVFSISSEKYIWHIFSDSLFLHSIWHSFLTFYSGILSGISSDILSGILSGIKADIFSGILSGIRSHILFGIYFDILSGIYSGFPSDIVS